MRVRIHGLVDGGVPRHLLNYLEVYAFAEQQGDGRVPKVVKANLRQPGALQEGLKDP